MDFFFLETANIILVEIVYGTQKLADKSNKILLVQWNIKITSTKSSQNRELKQRSKPKIATNRRQITAAAAKLPKTKLNKLPLT
jgi:hypothetical protein